MPSSNSPYLQLVNQRDETERIRVLEFAAASKHDVLPSYSAGAHIDFQLGTLGVRSYSLMDWQQIPTPPKTYCIAVQREDDGDGGSKAMHDMEVGQTVHTSAPINDFELQNTEAQVLLLAGGIGVTPLISMATQLSAQNSARSDALMGFKDALLNAFPEQTTLYFDNQSPLNLTELLAEQAATTELYLCGPRGMIDAAKQAALEAGLQGQRIHIELFATPTTNDTDTAFEVELKDSGEVFDIPVGKTIIEVLEDAGKDLMYDCQRGDCGICQTDVVSGIPDHRDVVLSEADRAAGNVMQICVSRAKSSRLVLDL